jgi:hypothetical protein
MAQPSLDVMGFQHIINKSIDELDSVLRDINKKVPP